MTTSPVDNTKQLEAEIAAEMAKVRGASMRRLLRLQLEYRGRVLAWIENEWEEYREGYCDGNEKVWDH